MWQAFWAIAYKEFVQASRNKAMLRLLITLQILDFTMLAWIDITVRNMPAAIVDQDHSSESRELIERITATGTFDIKYLTSSTEQARSHIRSGRARAAIVIPPDYGRLRAAGAEARILALVDGSDSSSSNQAITSIEGVAARMNLMAQHEVVQPTSFITPHAVLMFNPQGRMTSFMLPGLLAIILGSGYGYLAVRGLAGERDGGNLERLLMTPMSYTGLILGKLAPYFIMGVLNGCIYLLVMRWGFGVPIRGNIVLLVVVMTLYVLTVLSLGSFLAAGAANSGEAMGKWNLINFPTLMLTGYIFPLSSLPKLLLPISYLLPATHFIELMRGICLRGASAYELAPDILYLIFAPIVFTLLAARKFSQTIMQ